jgi:hypothetical protein
MIDFPWMLLRLAVGLGSIEVAGYALLVLMLPRRSTFTPMERLALAFGLGSFGLTLWMLTLTFFQISFSLGSIVGPWLLLVLPGGWLAWQRGWLWEDCRCFLTKGRILATFGYKTEFSIPEKFLLLLLLAAFGFVFLRAASYPVWSPYWAWDALSTWGLKAKAFYLGQGIDMSRFEAHNYYPNLVPLLMAYLYFWLGSLTDSLVNAVFPLWGGALVVLFFSFLRRLGVKRVGALGAAAFLVLNGTTLIRHLFIAYADLALAYYQLAAAGLVYLWLREEAPAGSGPLLVCMFGGMAWSKYEGWPLVLITLLAAGLSLLWLRPPQLFKRIACLILVGAGGWFFSLPWRLYMGLQGLKVGGDHIGRFSLHQFCLGVWSVLKALVWIPYFGLLWPVILLCFIPAGTSLWRTPLIFLWLFVAGNLAAIALAYSIVPASPAEFPMYVRATVDRLLLHVAPASALIFSVPLASPGSISAVRHDFI